MLAFLIQAEVQQKNCCGSDLRGQYICWEAFVLRGVFSGMALELVTPGVFVSWVQVGNVIPVETLTRVRI